ncbi:MAG TPA: hypothetical protein VML01_11910 [Bryobacterales bacterium]|nr:hypothetical protein [Bryobacterales bacterium]
MRALPFILLAALYVVGCGARPFVIAEADTRFHESKDPLFYGENNRISSRSMLGGVHIDSRGIYMIPIVTKDQETGEVLSLALSVENVTEHNSMVGGSLMLGQIREIAFELDGKTLVLDVSEAGQQWADLVDFNTVQARSVRQVLVPGGI